MELRGSDIICTSNITLEKSSWILRFTCGMCWCKKLGNPPPPRPINTQLNLSTKYDQNINRKFKIIYWDINFIGHVVKSSKARRTFQRIWSVKFISQWTFFHGYNLYLCLRKANFSDFKSTCIKLYQELINHQTISLSRDHCKVKKWYLDRLKIFTEMNIFAFIWFIYMY